MGALVERLARFSGVSAGNPATFGAGASQAEVRYRAETVAYGYASVIDEYADPATEIAWCTLTVMLPCAVPTLALDHRSALGRPGVPVSGVQHPAFGEALFDQSYLVTSGYTETAETVQRLVGPVLRDTILRNPVQRVKFSGSTMLLRTFDGPRATDEVTEWLERVAGAILAATPAFVTPLGVDRPFPPGLYGPNTSARPQGRSAAHRPPRRGFRSRLTGRGSVRD